MVVALFMLLPLIPACESTVGEACTLIGCSSGIEVQLEETPAIPYRVEADAGGGDAKYVFECDSAEECPPIFFAEFTPDWLIINVISGTDTTWYEVRPSYEKNQPNGPACEPTCFNAVVRLPSDALATGG